MKIDRVNIKKTETRTRPDTHVAYIVEVQTKSQVWTVAHRFSDFVELNAVLAKEFPIRESLPPKKMFGSSSPEVTEQRRIGLERYLKSIVFSEIQPLANHSLLYQFLEFEPPANEVFPLILPYPSLSSYPYLPFRTSEWSYSHFSIYPFYSNFHPI